MAKFPCDRAMRSSNSVASIFDIGSGRGDDQRSVGDQRVPLRIWLIGQPEHIQGTIKNLHVLRFAEPHEWSQPMPWSAIDPTTQAQMLNFADGSLISICTRYFPQS
jgi:hypothetical protein